MGTLAVRRPYVTLWWGGLFAMYAIHMQSSIVQST